CPTRIRSLAAACSWQAVSDASFRFILARSNKERRMYRFHSPILGFASVLAMACAGAANATIISIDASKDVMVDGNGSNATTNYNTSNPELGWRFLASPARNEHSFIAFTLPGDIASIQSASLELFKIDSNTVKTLRLY